MIYIWFSALLFGMVHPGSKLILGSGIGLKLFCFSYIGIRLAVQLPFVIKTKAYKISSFGDLKIIFVLGLVGVSLQLSEFAGIAAGENVSTVTFLVYTHPFWSILISKFVFREKLGNVGSLKLMLAFVGIILVIGVDNFGIDNLLQHWVSLVAGLMIAIWIKVSNVARKEGFSTLKTNFYYDLMSFSCLLTLISLSPKGLEIELLTDYLSQGYNFITIAAYSIFIGLLPNLLFYKGSATTDSLTAGYILLLEPIIASVVALFMWGDAFSVTFVIGALLILSANIPNTFFEKRLKLAPALLLIFGLFVGLGVEAKEDTSNLNKIVLLEIIPADSSDYTVSSEKKQIEIAAELAIAKFKTVNKCNIELEKMLEVGNEEKLISKVNEIKKNVSNKIVVGLSRSNFARVAAKVASGTEIKAISIGASASNLGDINKNFMTMVNPWEEQFNLVRNSLSTSKCTYDETLGVFDPGNFISKNFLTVFQSAKLGHQILAPQKINFNNKYRCIFIGLNFSQSSEILASLKTSNWQGEIVGIGDWNIHSKELENISTKLSSKIQISVPTGWIPESSEESTSFGITFQEQAKEIASPIAAYVYDGVLLASEALCNGTDIYGEIKTTPQMLRTYKGRNKTGNLLSNMYLKSFKGSL